MNTPAPRIQKTTYGQNAIGQTRLSTDYGSQTWWRDDVYTASTGEVAHESRFAASRDDQSDMAIVANGGYPGNVEYDSACSSCYLHHSHTVAAHRRNLGLVHDCDQPPILTAQEWFDAKRPAFVI